jgi:hypothetical protein
MGHVGAVVESQLRPAVSSIRSVKTEAAVVLAGGIKGIEAIVVTGGTIGDIPGSRRVIELGSVVDVVVNGSLTLVDVGVAGEYQINAVLEEQRLKNVLTGPADGA